jgi:hypothetical protein
MSLVTWKYERRSRLGPGKQYEQRGDVQGMLTALIRDAELHGAWDEVERLKAELYPQPKYNPAVPPYTEPEKPRRKRKAKPSPPSSDQKLRQAWRTVDELRGRAD